VMITHDPDDLPDLADTVAHLRPPDEDGQPSHVELAPHALQPSNPR